MWRIASASEMCWFCDTSGRQALHVVDNPVPMASVSVEGGTGYDRWRHLYRIGGEGYNRLQRRCARHIDE